jgi:hypothetical protein
MPFDERLESVRTMLQADGYDLEVDPRFPGPAFQIVTLENACEDCLVGKDVMASVIGQALGVPPNSITLTYPAGSVHEH